MLGWLIKGFNRELWKVRGGSGERGRKGEGERVGRRGERGDRTAYEGENMHSRAIITVEKRLSERSCDR